MAFGLSSTARVVLAIVLATAPQARSDDGGKKGKAMDSWYITHTRPLPAGVVSLLIESDRSCHMVITADPGGVPFANRSEIGIYQNPITADRLDRLKLLVDEAAKAPPSVRPSVPPGTPILAFGVGKGDDPGTLASFPLNGPLPEKVKLFDEAMKDLSNDMLDHRYRTVKGTAVWDVAELTPGKDLKLRLTLRNTGSMPVKIHNPAAAKDQDEVGLLVQIEKDLPAEQLEAGDRAFFRPKPGEVTQPADPEAEPGDKPKPIVTLDKDEELVVLIAVRRHLYINSGSFRGSVSYTGTLPDGPDEEGVEGTLRAPAGKFNVSAKRSR